MASMTYAGPADVLVVGEKAYHPGDSVSLSEAQAAALQRGGHTFKETLPKAGDPRPPSTAVEPSRPVAVPTGDDGGLMQGVSGPAAPSKAAVKQAEQHQEAVQDRAAKAAEGK